MNWITWLIPLIALVVWILANLFKTPEDPQRRNPRPMPRPNPFAAPGRPPQTDLDRFIEEAKRRRQQTEQRRNPERLQAPPPLPVPDSAPPVVRPAPAVARPAPSGPVMPPPLPRQVAEVPLTVIPAARPAAAPARPSPPPVEQQEATALQQARSAPLPAAYATRQPLPAGARSESAQQALQLLGNSSSARVAFLLREILDRPVSRRPRRS